jgi:hypothetical protein
VVQFASTSLNSHLSGLVVSIDTETVLEDALEMYECSLGLMHVGAPGGTDNLVTNIAICQCLILNNMAHVLYELHEYSESTDCLKCLQEVLDKTNGLDEKLPRLQSKQVLVCVCVTSDVAICDLLSDTHHDMVAIAVIAVIVIGLYQVVQVVLDSGRR